ncbi:MAG: hypothetical protein HOL15_03350 [Nitrospinaceae bacterium]|nr:hypothetical protein [Nitrospinaceae bacterium]
MKRLMISAICLLGFFVVLSGTSLAVSKEYLFPPSTYKPPCDTSKTTVCTIELWLGHKHKKQKKEIKKFLKSKSLKVLHHTIQFWRRGNGHPPTNIAIGSGVSAEDARMVIDIALEFNDNIEHLILRPLNPPNYVAIATSAWDKMSEVDITPKQLEMLRNPELNTEEFHTLYYEMTNEGSVKKDKFY